MAKIDKYIEIVRTENTHFSSMGAKSCEMIRAVLSKHYQRVGISIVNTVSDLEILTIDRPDLVFLGLKKLPSLWDIDRSRTKDIWLPEYLDARGLNYTGSAKSAIKLDYDKESAKARIRQAGLPTAPSFTSSPGQYLEMSNLPLQFPLFMKPLNAGGGAGIGADSVVRNFSEFQNRDAAIFNEFESGSLVEQYLTGREFSVAILDGRHSGDLIAMPVELITEENSKGDRILGSGVKTDDNELVIAVEDAQARYRIGLLAKNIYRALGGRDYGRIDIRMDGAHDSYFLEANLMPGLGRGYFFRACSLNRGMSYEAMILEIAQLSLARSADRQRQSVTHLSQQG